MLIIYRRDNQSSSTWRVWSDCRAPLCHWPDRRGCPRGRLPWPDILHQINTECGRQCVQRRAFLVRHNMTCTPRRSLYDRISRRNRNRIRKYFSLFIRDQKPKSKNGVESWKKLRSKILWHTSFKAVLRIRIRIQRIRFIFPDPDLDS